jgi:hypothetical protein
MFSEQVARQLTTTKNSEYPKTHSCEATLSSDLNTKLDLAFFKRLSHEAYRHALDIALPGGSRKVTSHRSRREGHDTAGLLLPVSDRTNLEQYDSSSPPNESVRYVALREMLVNNICSPLD